ncbi:MAG: DnaJ domain-containing protein, partial [Oscillospiraceae bacterium]|nr:DnaJ domain-containing protein [Oscillospiraceae bacterium]
MNIPDYYSALGIPRFTNDFELIKKAYTSQIKFFHPDANNVPPDIAVAKTRQLIDAYNVLKNSESKYYYDYTLRSQLNMENTSSYTAPPKTANHSQTV